MRFGYKKTLTLIVLAGILASCSEQEMRDHKVRRTQSIVEDLTYAKDTRTGLCFAVGDQTYGGAFLFTYVPCDKVEKYLRNESEVEIK